MRLAVCARCGLAGWVNLVTVRGRCVGEWCAACFEQAPHDSNEAPRTRNPGSGPYHNDPGFDDVIRALEEDR